MIFEFEKLPESKRACLICRFHYMLLLFKKKLIKARHHKSPGFEILKLLMKLFCIKIKWHLNFKTNVAAHIKNSIMASEIARIIFKIF